MYVSIKMLIIVCLLCEYYLCNFQLLMLTTNMIRKDLNSQNQYDAGVALSALACFISPDLARDLANDIMTLVTFILLYHDLKSKFILLILVVINKTVFEKESCTYDV